VLHVASCHFWHTGLYWQEMVVMEPQWIRICFLRASTGTVFSILFLCWTHSVHTFTLRGRQCGCAHSRMLLFVTNHIVAFPEKLLKTIATRGAIFSLKFTKNRLAAALCPDLLGEIKLKHSPEPLAAMRGPTSMGGDGGGKERREGRIRERGEGSKGVNPGKNLGCPLPLLLPFPSSFSSPFPAPLIRSRLWRFINLFTYLLPFSSPFPSPPLFSPPLPPLKS